jgi:hypothetical protein
MKTRAAFCGGRLRKNSASSSSTAVSFPPTPPLLKEERAAAAPGEKALEMGRVAAIGAVRRENGFLRSMSNTLVPPSPALPNSQQVAQGDDRPVTVIPIRASLVRSDDEVKDDEVKFREEEEDGTREALRALLYWYPSGAMLSSREEIRGRANRLNSTLARTCANGRLTCDSEE